MAGALGAVLAVAVGSPAAGGLFGSSPPDVSGTYVIQNEDGAEMLRLVQAKDGSVSGQLTGIAVSAAGVVQDEAGTLSGSISGSTVRLHIEAASPVELPSDLTGTLDDEGLALSGTASPGSPALKARRGQPSDFDSLVATWRQTAQRRASAAGAAAAQLAQEAALLQQLRDIAERFGERAGKTEGLLSRSGALEAGFRGFTTRMSSLLAQEQAQPDDHDHAIARGRIATDISIVTVDRNMFRIDMERFERQVSDDLGAIQRDAAKDQSGCDTLLPAASRRGSPRQAELQAACARLAALAASYQADTDKLNAALAHLKDTIKTELAAQAMIQSEAQRLR